MKIGTVKVPIWAKIGYIAALAVLVPWTFDLAQSLPQRHVVRHWDAAWVGFDIIIVLVILANLILAFRRSINFTISSSVLFVILLVDSWFDIITAKAGVEQKISIALAVFVEIPLSLMALWLASKTLSNALKK